jgi:hypothetical protein
MIIQVLCPFLKSGVTFIIKVEKLFIIAVNSISIWFSNLSHSIVFLAGQENKFDVVPFVYFFGYI